MRHALSGEGAIELVDLIRFKPSVQIADQQHRVAASLCVLGRARDTRKSLRAQGVALGLCARVGQGTVGRDVRTNNRERVRTDMTTKGRGLPFAVRPAARPTHTPVTSRENGGTPSTLVNATRSYDRKIREH